MKFKHIKQFSQRLTNRLIFQNASEAAPRAPEDFKNNEKNDQAAAMVSESPSSIMSSAVAKSTTISTRYKQSTAVLANLINDPTLGMMTSGSAGGTTSTSTTTTVGANDNKPSQAA